MSHATTRREMFKGLALGAGATVLTPILGQLAAHAAGADAARRKRVVFVLQSNGMSPDHIRPAGVDKPKGEKIPSADRVTEVALGGRNLHAAIEPLTPFRDRLALVQNLSGRIAYSDHSCNHGALGCYPKSAGPRDRTVDHVVAEALPGVFSHVGLGLSGKSDGGANYNHSASGPGQASPVVCSPEKAYKSLFGSVADGAKGTFDQRSVLLDFMADDVRRSRQALAGEERHKFDQYLRAFEALSARQAELAAMREDLAQNAPEPGAKLTTSESSLVLEAQFEIGAAALVCGLTNVLLITSGSGNQSFGSFPEFGIPGLHRIGHGGSYGEMTAEDCFTRIRNFHTKQIAGLAAKLQSVAEGDGTMLDNTVIVYLSDSGDGHHPSLYQWPVVVLGDLGGKLRTGGRYLELPGYGRPGHRTLANFYCSLLHAVGCAPGRVRCDRPGPPRHRSDWGRHRHTRVTPARDRTNTGAVGLDRAGGPG